MWLSDLNKNHKNLFLVLLLMILFSKCDSLKYMRLNGKKISQQSLETVKICLIWPSFLWGEKWLHLRNSCETLYSEYFAKTLLGEETEMVF